MIIFRINFAHSYGERLIMIYQVNLISAIYDEQLATVK
jgi:ABC-type uncharacterized transport system ATPase component